MRSQPAIHPKPAVVQFVGASACGASVARSARKRSLLQLSRFILAFHAITAATRRLQDKDITGRKLELNDAR
jgi:hypothetical protein